VETKGQYIFEGCDSLKNWGAAAFFSEEYMTMLEGIMYPKKTKAGSHIFWEGDQTGKLYFIKSGQVKLFKFESWNVFQPLKI
jgi:CRP-like cAMP-binding protein